MTQNDQRQWVGNEGVADRYDVSIETVRKWRKEGTGPAGIRFGRHVRYSLAELERWEREQAARQLRASA